jgi:hypothetical protein
MSIASPVVPAGWIDAPLTTGTRIASLIARAQRGETRRRGALPSCIRPLQRKKP